jgi:hypothetical protein
MTLYECLYKKKFYSLAIGRLLYSHHHTNMRSSRSILNIIRVQSSLVPKQFSTMSSNRQVERGTGDDASHATGPSKVPGSLQDAAPKDVEESLPDSVSIHQRKWKA